jgi:oligosaccharide repeat unit polymerase
MGFEYFGSTIIVVFICLVYLLTVRYDLFANPAFFLVFFQLLNFIGSIQFIDVSIEADRIYFALNVIALFSMLMGLLIGDVLFPVGKRSIKIWKKKPLIIETGVVYSKLLYILVLISVAICVLYYVSVGYNVFLLGVFSLFQGGGVVEDVSSLRLASYNSNVTGKYFYPGYVNQFKNTLLPLSLVYLWVSKSNLPGGSSLLEKLLLGILSLLALVFILGTGQRGAFIIVMLMVGAFIMVVASEKKRKKVIFYGIIFALSFFVLSTYLLGRAGTEEFNLAEIFESIFFRIVGANQYGATLGFRYVIFPENIQWGGEWWRSLVGLLPGVEGSTLSNRIARQLWGGFGTAPPSNVGSTYYNFGISGVILVPLLFSLALKYMYKRLYSKDKKMFRTLIYIFSFVLIGTWIAGNPINFYFNTGLVAIIVLKLGLNFSERIFGRKYYHAE